VVGLYLLRASAFGEQGHRAREAIVPGRTGQAEASRLRQDASEAFALAEVDYRRALKLNPSDDLRYDLLTQRGLLRLRADRLDEGIADLEAAIRLRPDGYQAHATTAQVHRRRGRLADAEAAFGRAIACGPEPAVLATLHRSRGLLHAGRKDLSPGQQAAA